MKSDLVDIECQLKRETLHAWLIFDGSRAVWIPKSKAKLAEDKSGYIITMPEWLAADKELI